MRLQGNWQQHIRILAGLTHAVPVRPVPVDGLAALRTCHALVIPGGESTVISNLLQRQQLLAPLGAAAAAGFPLLGYCAGAILMAKNIERLAQPPAAPATLGVLDICIRRNAYGRQIASFTTEITIFGNRRRAVFIRAPQITEVGQGIEVLARHQNAAVAVRRGPHVAVTFHPEVAGWDDIHSYFVRECIQQPSARLFQDYQ